MRLLMPEALCNSSAAFLAKGCPMHRDVLFGPGALSCCQQGAFACTRESGNRGQLFVAENMAQGVLPFAAQLSAESALHLSIMRPNGLIDMRRRHGKSAFICY